MFDLIFNTSDIDSTLDRLANMSIAPFQKDVGTYLQTKIRKNLSGGVDYQGKPFSPLTTGYAKRKAKAGFGDLPILTATHAMEESLFGDIEGDELLMTVHGIHSPIKGLNTISEPMEDVARGLETGKHGKAERRFLGLTELDTEWILDRLGKMYAPDLT